MKRSARRLRPSWHGDSPYDPAGPERTRHGCQRSRARLPPPPAPSVAVSRPLDPLSETCVLTLSGACRSDDMRHALQDKYLPSLKRQKQHRHALFEVSMDQESLQQHGRHGAVPSPLTRLFCAPRFGINSIAYDACHRLVQPGLVWRRGATRTPNMLG